MLLVLLGLFLVLALGVAATVLLALRPQQLSPFDQQTSWEAAKAKLDSVPAQLKQGKAQVTLSQTEVRAIISQELSGTNSAVKGVDVALTPGHLEVRATVTLNGNPATVTLGGAPTLVGQNLVLAVDRVQVGSVPMPVDSALRLLAYVHHVITVDVGARTVTVPLSNLRVDGKPVRLDSLALDAGQLTVNMSSR
ncbi:MAG: hypothetical protein ACYC5Y_03750 [Symbiobacteriia bacterium]